MRLLVCVKQVPDTSEIRINPETNTLIRAGVNSIINPFDAYALETANRIKDSFVDSKIVVISMGPAQAKDVLKQCLASGADKAYLVNDSSFGGSDTLATSYILSKAVLEIQKKEGIFDIVFCGRQAIDGDTAQVGPELAEHLDYPQITRAVDVLIDSKMVTVKKETNKGYEVLGTKMPCVLTIDKTPYELRYPNIRAKLAANKAEISVLTAKDIDIDLGLVGLISQYYTPELRYPHIN